MESDKVFQALWDSHRRSGDKSADDQALMNKTRWGERHIEQSEQTDETLR
ncbi:MAG: hypothetical protein LBU32_14980 [Clostridiales bacterium]|nr:hypothetical protein [Clostridiales bacterium]